MSKMNIKKDKKNQHNKKYRKTTRIKFKNKKNNQIKQQKIKIIRKKKVLRIK